MTNDKNVNQMPDFVRPEDIEREDAKMMSEAGVLIGSKERSATMVVRDNQPVCVQNDSQQFEMLPIAVALEHYEWLRENYFFHAMPKDYDSVVAQCAAQEKPLGFFIHVKKGADVKLPCQTAMYMASEDVTQILHNIVVLEEGASLELITGCLTRHSVKKGQHMAVEEYYVGKGAKLVGTMVHSWSSKVMVYPRAAVIVEENGRYESNYIALKPAKQIISNPQTFLNGQGASAKFLTVVLGAAGSVINNGGSVYLNADDTSAELVHRGICTGGEMFQGGMLVGKARCKAHVDCAGMLLDDTGKGFIKSVPGVEAHHPDARMSHEASIGKIAPEQVEYLMSRGMGEQEAVSLLIRGFLGRDIEGLGAELDSQIADIASMAGHGEK